MTLKSYAPHLECENPKAPPTQYGPMQACQSVLNSMQVATYDQMFGERGIPAILSVDVPLPITISDGQTPRNRIRDIQPLS